MKPIAVVILNWNGAKLLEEFLPTIVKHTPSRLADIIVADNGSTDSSRTLLEERFPRVKKLYFEKNLGFAEGYNRAISETGYEYTVLLNSDAGARRDWLTPLYDFMESHRDFGAVQPKILSWKEPGRFEYAGAAGGYIDRHGYPYCRGRIFETTEEDRGQYNSDVEVHWASGAALMVRSKAYLDAGGLDSAFFAHMEEIDLCWRMRTHGWKIGAVGSSAIYHLGGGSLPPGNPRKVYLNFRNNLLMMRKNLPRKGRMKALIVRRIMDAMAFGYYFLRCRLGSCTAIVRAHLAYLWMSRQYPRDNATGVDLTAGAPDIVKAYYLKKKRRYTDL